MVFLLSIAILALFVAYLMFRTVMENGRNSLIAFNRIISIGQATDNDPLVNDTGMGSSGSSSSSSTSTSAVLIQTTTSTTSTPSSTSSTSTTLCYDWFHLYLLLHVYLFLFLSFPFYVTTATCMIDVDYYSYLTHTCAQTVYMHTDH